MDEKIVYERKSNEFLCKNSSVTVEFILLTDLRSEAFLYFRPRHWPGMLQQVLWWVVMSSATTRTAVDRVKH